MNWLEWLNQFVYYVTINHLILTFIMFLVIQTLLSFRNVVSKRDLVTVQTRLKEIENDLKRIENDQRIRDEKTEAEFREARHEREETRESVAYLRGEIAQLKETLERSVLLLRDPVGG